MDETGKRKSGLWIWWLVAIGLLPLSFFMWLYGLEGAWRQSIGGVALILSPFVALAGVIWLVVLCVITDRRLAARWAEEDRNHRR
jgi:hypothetical protein